MCIRAGAGNEERPSSIEGEGIHGARKACAALAFALACTGAWGLDGIVVDAQSGQPVADAKVVSGTAHARSDPQGVFQFEADEIRAQVDAAESLGTSGWMLWNAHNRYTPAGLAPSRR